MTKISYFELYIWLKILKKTSLSKNQAITESRCKDQMKLCHYFLRSGLCTLVLVMFNTRLGKRFCIQVKGHIPLNGMYVSVNYETSMTFYIFLTVLLITPFPKCLLLQRVLFNVFAVHQRACALNVGIVGMETLVNSRVWHVVGIMHAIRIQDCVLLSHVMTDTLETRVKADAQHTVKVLHVTFTLAFATSAAMGIMERIVQTIVQKSAGHVYGLTIAARAKMGGMVHYVTKHVLPTVCPAIALRTAIDVKMDGTEAFVAYLAQMDV